MFRCQGLQQTTGTEHRAPTEGSISHEVLVFSSREAKETDGDELVVFTGQVLTKVGLIGTPLQTHSFLRALDQ